MIKTTRQTHSLIYKNHRLPAAQFVPSVDGGGAVCVAGNSSSLSIAAEPFSNCPTKTILITAGQSIMNSFSQFVIDAFTIDV